MVTSRPRRLVFVFEVDLEDYLEVQLSLLVSLLGQDLLVIGRQVKTVDHGAIDLLAIDATGVIYIIELKLNEASPSVIAQILDYRRWIKRLNKEGIIRLVADGGLNVDLTDALERHFGRPLPKTVNDSQVLMIIAASIHRRTAHSILELKDCGYSITTLRYVVNSDSVRLIPCCRDDQDVEALHAKVMPPVPRKSWLAPALHRSPIHRVKIAEDIRQFWLSDVHHFTRPIVTFRFAYEQYKQWFRSHRSKGLPLPFRTEGDFGRQMAAIVAESGEWTSVFIAPGGNTNTLETLTSPPSTRFQRDASHWIAAYLRHPVYRESEAK